MAAFCVFPVFWGGHLEGLDVLLVLFRDPEGILGRSPSRPTHLGGGSQDHQARLDGLRHLILFRLCVTRFLERLDVILQLCEEPTHDACFVFE